MQEDDDGDPEDESLSPEDAKKALEKLGASLNGRLDQRFAPYRARYEEMEPAAKRLVKEWIKRLADASKNAPFIERGYLRCYVTILSPEEGPCDINPGALLRAIEAWEKGEEYQPSLKDL